MQYLGFFMLACALVILTGCNSQGRDYEASAICYDKGYKAGTQAYDDCVQEEKMLRLQRQLEEREEIQRRREEQQKMLRY